MSVSAVFGRAVVALVRRETPFWVDCVIGLLLLLSAGVGGTAYWKRTNTARLPLFYQSYFEPSVMIACGKGFVVAQPPVPAVSTFLAQEVDQLSCAAIPPDTKLGTQGLYQGAWRYLMYAVGLAWRILGISWSGLGPLFGALFAITALSLYAIFRLGASPLLAGLAAAALGVSRLHLAYLPNLRDYAKAPITLVLIFLLGLLVARRTRWKSVLSLAAVYGAVLGVGYGFRTDFLVNLPALALTLFFLEGGVFRNIPLKVLAVAVCLGAFLLTGWPIISSVYRSGGCQWHSMLLGFSSNFSEDLGLREPPYEVNRRYSDDFTYTTVTSYAARLAPESGHIEYCQPAYDAATAQFLGEIVRRFPADVMIRTYASVLQIVELSFVWKPELPIDLDTSPYSDSQRPKAHGIGLAVVIVAIAFAAIASVRIGLSLLFLLLYFGGYPAIQFDARHYFHLEFITWWASAFALQSVISDVWPLLSGREQRPALTASVRRAGFLLLACAAVLIATLWGARLYQQHAARALLGRYLAANREEIRPDPSSSPGRRAITLTRPGTDPETADFLDVDLNEHRCGPNPSVAFRYDRAARREFSRTFVLRGPASMDAPTHIFTPVYDGFQAIELSDTRPGCVQGVYRVSNPQQFSLLLEAVLRPGWEASPLYQQLQLR